MKNPQSKPLLLFLVSVILLLPAVSQGQLYDNKSKALPGDNQLASYYEAGTVSIHTEDYDRAREIGYSEVIRLALQQNLALQATIYNAQIRKAAYDGSFSLYDPQLSAVYRDGEIHDFLSTAVPTEFEREYSETTVTVSQRLPVGTELSLSGQLYEQKETPQPALDPAYDSSARLTLVQPLLKGFGTTATEQTILYSEKESEIALEDLRATAFQVVADVRNAYFETLQARYALSYREASVQLAQRIARENKARVEAGILAPVEKLEAEVGLQSRERLLLDAQRSYFDALDRFNLLLNSGDEYYRPVLQSFSMDFAATEEEGIAAAIDKRPDVARRIREIEKNRIAQSLARNALLPELNVVASYSQNGFDSNRSESTDMVRDGDYDSWEVGLELLYPLFNIEGRNQLKRADIALQEQRTLLAQLHNEVRNEVRSAIRRINVNRKKTEVARRGHDLATEKLRILMKSREVGLATTRDVLDGEEDLASARNDQIISHTDYFKSITAYLQATGTLLDNERIVFSGHREYEETRSPFHLLP